MNPSEGIPRHKYACSGSLPNQVRLLFHAAGFASFAGQKNSVAARAATL